jgi:hypothetical protein
MRREASIAVASLFVEVPACCKASPTAKPYQVEWGDNGLAGLARQL